MVELTTEDMVRRTELSKTTFLSSKYPKTGILTKNSF